MFRTGAIAAGLLVLACLASHVLPALGIVQTAAWLEAVRPALVLALALSASLAGYAALQHHRRYRRA